MTEAKRLPLGERLEGEQWRVDEDGRPDMEWNRHIYVAGTDNRVCFMAHSNGRDPDLDAARARLVAAAPQMRRDIDILLANIAELVEDGGDLNPEDAALIDEIKAAYSSVKGAEHE